MKSLIVASVLVTLFALARCEPAVSKRPLQYHNWPAKNAKQFAFGRTPTGQKRTLVVQIRSDQPVPLVLKGRPGAVGHAHAQPYAHSHVHVPAHSHLHHHILPHTHLRGPRPVKLSSSHYLKNSAHLFTKPSLQKPLKLKLTNIKQKSKPAQTADKPFQYEKPHALYTQPDLSEVQKLPLETHANFISDHFTPIHTIPAPNLALHDNHLHPEESYLPPQTPKPQKYHPSTTTNSPAEINNEYQVVEDITNDHTVRDPISGSQKLFAPDPDPSLPASKIRPATEPFNQPSNGKPLPTDVQNNFITPAQPLVQIVNAQHAVPEIYPIQYSQQAHIQHFGTAIQPASIPIYNPTYLVQQSNNLYTQHKQQLFHPETNVVEVGYVNADLTQEVASDGQILQAAKDVHNNIHPVLDSAPQFAALIAAPVLNEAQNSVETAPFRLSNIAAASATPEGGFVVSNYYNNNPQDSSQLLQAYAEEESQRQPQEIEQASFELQLQQQQQHQLEQLQYEQQQQQQQFEQYQLEQQQQQQQQLLQQQQDQVFQLQQQHFNQQQYPQQQALQQQQQQFYDINPRLAQQQIGQNSPLRIFVPDDETVADLPRLQKRSDTITRGTVEDVKVSAGEDNDAQNDSFEVTSSVEVSNGSQAKQNDNENGALQ